MSYLTERTLYRFLQGRAGAKRPVFLVVKDDSDKFPSTVSRLTKTETNARHTNFRSVERSGDMPDCRPIEAPFFTTEVRASLRRELLMAAQVV